jgi:hypothetical protein
MGAGVGVDRLVRRLGGVAIAVATALGVTTLTAGAASSDLPQARATVYRLAYVNLPSATDSISAGTYAGTRGWRGQITNVGAELVSAPTVSALNADPSWSFTPAVTLPVAVGPGADLASGEELRNDAISASGPGSSQVSDTPVHVGYDATRSMSPVSIPAGGGIQNVSVTLTLRSTAYEHGYAAIEVSTHDPSSPGPVAIVGGSIHDPALGSGESPNPVEPPAADRYQWAIGNAVLNKPYTLELQIQVPAGRSDYKPFVTVRGGKFDSFPDLDAASTEITDPVLQGAFAFSAGSTVHWSRVNSEVVSTNFSAVDAAPPGYSVSLDSSEYTVHAGGSVDLGATVTPSDGFTGEVTFWLTTTGVDPKDGWPQPFFPTSPWPVAHIPGLDHVTLGLGAPQNMPLGDYDLTLGANATGARIPDRTVRLQVHVVAPLSAFVTRTGAQLMLDHQPFRAVGMNIYNANSNGWCNFAMDGTLVDDALTSIGNGQTAIRAWFFQQLATTNGQRDWTAFDRTLAAAKAHHVKVIATLVDQWGPCGVTRPNVEDFKDTTWYTQRYKEPDPIGTVSYRDWAQEIAARYKNDPTVLAWQLVNEPEVQPYAGAGCEDEAASAAILQDFAADVSGAIRSVDPNHLISLGTIGSGQCGAQSTDYVAVMNIPTLDLCEFHDYNPADAMPGDQWNGLATRIEECNALHKPLLVGEIGIKPSDVGGTLADRARAIAGKFCAQFSAGVAGALVWNWDSHGSLANSFEVGPGDPVLALFAPWSDPRHGCAPPTAPRNMIAAAGDGSASISWIAPASDGGAPVTGYRITASPGGATVSTGRTQTTASFAALANGTAYTFSVVALNAAGAGGPSSATPVTPSVGALAPTTVAGDVAPGGTVSTANAGNPTPAQPVGVAVTVPAGGEVSIATVASPTAAPSSYDLVGQQVQIVAPPAGIAAPLQLVFTLDASVLGPGGSATTVQIFRDGIVLPACLGSGSATPDPCVAQRETLSGGDDVRMTVLTSHASLWGFGVAGTPVVIPRQVVAGPDRVRPGDVIGVGYAFTLVGRHAAGTAVFWNTSATFTARCTKNGPTFPLVVAVARRTSSYNASSLPAIRGLTPGSVFQGTSTVPNLCSGAPILLSGGTFNTHVRLSAAGRLLTGWYYRVGGTAAGGGITTTTVP